MLELAVLANHVLSHTSVGILVLVYSGIWSHQYTLLFSLIIPLNKKSWKIYVPDIHDSLAETKEAKLEPPNGGRVSGTLAHC